MPAALRLDRFGLFKLKFWLLQHKPTTAHAVLGLCRAASPTSAQLLPAAALLAPSVSALCRWLCSTPAMEQDEMQPGSLLLAQTPPSLAHCCGSFPPSQFLSQRIHQPGLAGSSEAALFIPG